MLFHVQGRVLLQELSVEMIYIAALSVCSRDVRDSTQALAPCRLSSVCWRRFLNIFWHDGRALA